MGDDQLDFELPEEVLSVIPMDPFEQLDLARKITSMAIASRVSNLDSEVVELRQKLLGKESVVRELEEKASRLERDCREADSRLKVVLEDNMNLTKEKDSLAMTVTKLTRDLAKLETFKRQLIKSLSDESGPQTEPVDIRTCDQPGSYPGKGTASITDSQL
jgi:chromosome segregation ATPase